MVAAGIFLCLLLVLLSMLRRRGRLTVALFLLSFVLVTLLFLHHATDSLNLNL